MRANLASNVECPNCNHVMHPRDKHTIACRNHLCVLFDKPYQRPWVELKPVKGK